MKGFFVSLAALFEKHGAAQTGILTNKSHYKEAWSFEYLKFRLSLTHPPFSEDEFSLSISREISVWLSSFDSLTLVLKCLAIIFSGSSLFSWFKRRDETTGKE